MKWLLVVVSSLSVSACAVSREVAVGQLINPLRLPVIAPSGDNRRDVTIATADGLTLEGWLFSPPEGRPTRGLVVFLHGKDANRAHFVQDAARFTARGYTVLGYDQRAHGRSPGEYCTYGAKEVPDLQRALDTFAVPGLPVVLIGESMGAAVALQAAAKDPRVTGVVAAASFSDLRTIVREHTPFFMNAELTEQAVHEAEAKAGFAIDGISPMRDAATIHVPTLLLHGTDDTFIPLPHSYRIRQALTQAPAELVVLEGVKHIDVLLHDESWHAIETWFDRVTLAAR